MTEKDQTSGTPACAAEDTHSHAALLEEIRHELPDNNTLYDLADLFKIFGDTTRVKILYALFESELCVCALAELLDVSQSAVSHQLRVLKDAELVTRRRDGKTNTYFLADEHVRSIIGQGYEHLTEDER